jgi:hypothetical protein
MENDPNVTEWMTAVGTVGAVVVALGFGGRGHHPKTPSGATTARTLGSTSLRSGRRLGSPRGHDPGRQQQSLDDLQRPDRGLHRDGRGPGHSDSAVHRPSRGRSGEGRCRSQLWVRHAGYEQSNRIHRHVRRPMVQNAARGVWLRRSTSWLDDLVPIWCRVIWTHAEHALGSSSSGTRESLSGVHMVRGERMCPGPVGVRVPPQAQRRPPPADSWGRCVREGGPPG